MKVSQANKLQFATPFTGVALLKKETVVFTYTPGDYAEGALKEAYIGVDADVKYVSDAMYRVTGGQNDLPRPWSWAPRKFYLYNEAYTPTPRVYLYKVNTPTGVKLQARIYNAHPITRTYDISVDVYMFVSHFL